MDMLVKWPIGVVKLAKTGRLSHPKVLKPKIIVIKSYFTAFSTP